MKRSRQAVHFVDVALAAEAEQVLFVDGEEEERRHRLHRKTLDLRAQPEPLDRRAPAHVPHRDRPRGTVMIASPELELTMTCVRSPSI